MSHQKSKVFYCDGCGRFINECMCVEPIIRQAWVYTEEEKIYRPDDNNEEEF